MQDLRSISPYGQDDKAYLAAGKEAGLQALAEEFYWLMEELPEAETIRKMHKEDLGVMTDKLTLFLTMFLGGPKTYREKYKFVGMPVAHQHFIINEPERDAWLLCFDTAVDKQPWADDFKFYIKNQIRFPAEMIRRTSRKS